MPPNQAEELSALADLLTSTLNLLVQSTTFLNPSVPLPPCQHIDKPPNPLHVLRDSATLIKAHTTKISLLAINKPFTPSTIRKVLNELASTCLPAMLSAVQICEQEKAVWGTLMGNEVQARTRRVLLEMTTLLQEVQAIASGDDRARRRDSVASTGVVWESCDAVIELEQLGIAGLAEHKAQQYRDTIKDAIEELREWMEGEDPDTEGHDALLDDNDEGVEGDRDSVEDIFHAANSMPNDRPGLKRLVEAADGKLKKIVLLYAALIKRRLRPFKSFADKGTAGDTGEDEGEGVSKRLAELNIKHLDGCMESLRKIPHLTDELASCFYDLDEGRAMDMLGSVVREARSAADAVDVDWHGKEDEFTAWRKTWIEAIG